MKETPRYYLRGITEPKNVSKAAGALAVATLAVSVACGGGGSADNPTQTDTNPDATPGNTLVVTSTPGEIPEVTLVPTPEIAPSPKPTEKPLWGLAPTFEDLSQSIDIALNSFGGATLPDPLQSVDILNKHLGWCNEEGLEGVAPELYANGVLNGCTAVGEELKNMFEQAGSVEIKAALDQCRDFTLGEGGKVDQLNAAGKPGIGSGKFYKLDLLETYFTPGK